MKKIDEIANTNIGISINSNYIIFEQDGNVLKYNLADSSKQFLFKSDFKTHTVQEIDNSIYLIGSKGVKEYRGGRFNIIERSIGDYSIYSKRFIYSSLDYDYENHLSKSGCIDIITNDVVWSGEFGENLKSKNGNTFSISSSKLAKRNQQTGEVQWEFKFNKTNYIPNLYIGNNYSLLAIAERNLLICFNNITGIKLWEQETIPRGIVMDDLTDTFHQLMINYNCFSLVDGSLVKQKNDRDYFQHIGIENQKDNYIQLGNTLLINDSTTRITGKFSIDDLQFEWTEKGLSIPEGYKMKKNEKYVFLVDSNKTLNIYEWKTG